MSIFGTHNGLILAPSVKYNATTALNTTLIKFPAACCPTPFRFLYFIERTENHIRHNIIETAVYFMLRKVDENKRFHVEYWRKISCNNFVFLLIMYLINP